MMAQVPLLFDLSARVKLRLSGNDCTRYLNGQLTNDVRKASDSAAIEACILSAKGKTDAHVFLHADENGFLLDGDPELREPLPARLERYIIADDVQIEDLSDRLSIFHLLGKTPPASIGEGKIVSVNRYAQPGHDIWVETARRNEVLETLLSVSTACDAACAEIFRVEQGIPRWGRELTNEIIPLEANLEARCIDYEKGCYIGQEIISRMKMSGQRNKQLCGLISKSPLSAKMRLFLITPQAKEAGWITSTVHSERLGKELALGYIKRGFNFIGSKLEARLPASASTGIPVEIVALPFLR